MRKVGKNNIDKLLQSFRLFQLAIVLSYGLFYSCWTLKLERNVHIQVKDRSSCCCYRKAFVSTNISSSYRIDVRVASELVPTVPEQSCGREIANMVKTAAHLVLAKATCFSSSWRSPMLLISLLASEWKMAAQQPGIKLSFFYPPDKWGGCAVGGELAFHPAAEGLFGFILA